MPSEMVSIYGLYVVCCEQTCYSRYKIIFVVKVIIWHTILHTIITYPIIKSPPRPIVLVLSIIVIINIIIILQQFDDVNALQVQFLFDFYEFSQHPLMDYPA